MPIKWGPQTDQKLLLKILESHPELAVNVAKVAKLWSDGNDADGPTAEAIRQRLGTIRKQAGINTPIRTTTARVKPSKTPHVRAEPEGSEMPDTQSPADRSKFLHSSFDTPYRNPGKKQASKSSSRKRKRAGNTSEDDAMSTSGSEADDDVPTAPVSSTKMRFSQRARNVKPKYDIKDLQSSGYEKSDADSDESDASYDPAKEREHEEAKLGKRNRARRTERQDEDIEEA